MCLTRNSRSQDLTYVFTCLCVFASGIFSNLYIHIHVHIHIHIHTDICVYIYMWVCVCVCGSASLCLFLYTFTYAYIYIYICHCNLVRPAALTRPGSSRRLAPWGPSRLHDIQMCRLGDGKLGFFLSTTSPIYEPSELWHWNIDIRTCIHIHVYIHVVLQV